MIRKKHLNTSIICFLFLFACVCSYAAQFTAIDSLKKSVLLAKTDSAKVNQLNALAYLYRNSFPDSTLFYTNQAISICKRLATQPRFKRWTGYANALGHLGIAYRLKGKYALAEKYYFAALQMDREINYSFGIGKRLVGISNFFTNVGNYPKALEYGYMALEVNRKIQNKRAIALSLSVIAKVFEEMGDFKKALSLNLETSKTFEEINDYNNITASYYEIAGLYVKMSDYSQALSFIEKSIQMSDRFQFIQEKADALNILVKVYLANEKAEKARKVVYENITLCKKHNLIASLGESYLHLGTLELHEKNYSAAQSNLLKSAEIFRQNGVMANLMQAEKKLATLFLELNNYREAFTHLSIEKSLHDSIFNVKNNQKILLLEYDKKANEEKLIQEKKDALLSREIERQKFVRNSFMAGFSMMFLFAGATFISYRRKRRDNFLIQAQKKIVDLKNREILDSIEYAKRIQTAILPPPRIVKEFLKNSFILYLPKDIVAGDFYWMESIDNTIYFAACDCTGHGVPGAMVSVVCNNALNRALNEFGERQPGKIFDRARELVLENFAKSDEEVKDGMDASLCALEINSKTLLWSGANNPLWVFRAADHCIEEIKGDKQPIGKGYDEKPFTTHRMNLNKGDIIYIFTDGYADQFGGEKGKKLTKAKFREFILSIAALPMEQQREQFLAHYDAYRGSLEQVDDVCVIGVRV